MKAQWYYVKDSQRYGPVSLALLKQLVQLGMLLPGDLVWKAGLPEWLSAGSLRGLFKDPGKDKTVGLRSRPSAETIDVGAQLREAEADLDLRVVRVSMHRPGELERAVLQAVGHRRWRSRGATVKPSTTWTTRN
jgi:hypothetical protein